MLLSPALPRLPGGLEPLPPAEPPLTEEEFAPRPPPLPYKPLPPDVAAKLAAGQGMQAALEGWRRKSQLGWCMEQLRRDEEAAAAAAEAAAAQQVRFCFWRKTRCAAVLWGQEPLVESQPPYHTHLPLCTHVLGPPAVCLHTG